MPAGSNPVTEPGGAKKTPDRCKSNRYAEDLRMAPIPRYSRRPAPAVTPGLDPRSFSPDGSLPRPACGERAGVRGPRPATTRQRTREIAFLDPGVADIATLLGHLRREVEPILLDPARPVARQIAAALAGECQLAAIHIIAHGAPGRVDFTAGTWSAETLAEDADDLTVLGRALAATGDLRLWSCQTAAGRAGAAFVADLAQASGAGIAAATGLVGAAALRGAWELTATAYPPLTATGQASYAGVLALSEITVTGTLPNGSTTGVVTHFIVDTATGTIVGQVMLPDAAQQNKSVAITIKVPSDRAEYSIGTFDSNGNFQPSSFLHVPSPTRDPRPSGAVGPSGR